MIKAVLFDLGNTLVRYWDRPAFPTVLREAIGQVQIYLSQQGLLRVSPQVMWQRVEENSHELPGHRVFPLRDRLARIFELRAGLYSGAMLAEMCRRFMVPIFGRGRLYADTLSTLDTLRDMGFKTAVVSNTPWGSPAVLWREEIGRLGIRERVDVDVFCDDVGWRKPARQIFGYTTERLGVAAECCLFVGDDPRWDLAGPRALGMEAVLIDRTGTAQTPEQPIYNLNELLDRLGQNRTAFNQAIQTRFVNKYSI